MTIIGAVTDADRAFVWADTQVYHDGTPSTHTAKLVVNPTGRFLACGTGWDELLREADHAAGDAVSLDAVLLTLPDLLRTQAAATAKGLENPADFRANVYLVAGYSTRLRRIVAHVMEAERFFVPRPVSAWCSPDVPDLRAMGAACWGDLAGVFTQQAVQMEREFKHAVTGAIVGATVTAKEVTAARLRELGVQAPLSASSSAPAAVTPAEEPEPAGAEVIPISKREAA